MNDTLKPRIPKKGKIDPSTDDEFLPEIPEVPNLCNTTNAELRGGEMITPNENTPPYTEEILRAEYEDCYNLACELLGAVNHYGNLSRFGVPNMQRWTKKLQELDPNKKRTSR